MLLWLLGELREETSEWAERKDHVFIPQLEAGFVSCLGTKKELGGSFPCDAHLGRDLP